MRPSIRRQLTATLVGLAIGPLLLVGAVLVTGARAPRLVKRHQLKEMEGISKEKTEELKYIG